MTHMKNFEGYSDPTACIALRNVEKEEKLKKKLAKSQNKKSRRKRNRKHRGNRKYENK